MPLRFLRFVLTAALGVTLIATNSWWSEGRQRLYASLAGFLVVIAACFYLFWCQTWFWRWRFLNCRRRLHFGVVSTRNTASMLIAASLLTLAQRYFSRP